MDLRRDERHNVLQPVGLITLLALVMRLRPGALLWMAPVCSTWVWVSRGTTGRPELSGPLIVVCEPAFSVVGVRGKCERNPARFDESFQSLIRSAWAMNPLLGGGIRPHTYSARTH